jgi:hypothetical protein
MDPLRCSEEFDLASRSTKAMGKIEVTAGYSLAANERRYADLGYRCTTITSCTRW